MESVRTLRFVGWCRVFCAVRRHKTKVKQQARCAGGTDYVNGRVGITNRLEGSTERQQLEAAAKQELEERLQEFAEHWRKAGTDVTDSYALLPGSDRALWHQYRDDETQYVEDLIYEVQVR